MVVPSKSFVLQHPYLIMKIMIGIIVLAISLLADPAMAMKIMHTQ